MASLSLPMVSVDHYLSWESSVTGKHEYVDGYIVAMAGASPAHNVVTTNIASAIHRRREVSSCLVLSSDKARSC
jgi:Uma2 family endonuclease